MSFDSSDVTTLSKSFSKKKVKATIDEMTPDKAPRPDDVIVGFFQKNQDVVGKDVLLAVMDVLNKGLRYK